MNRVWEAAIIAVGIIVLGFCVKSGLDSISSKDRKVTVKGLSEREVEADKVTWPILTKEIGDDLPANGCILRDPESGPTVAQGLEPGDRKLRRLGCFLKFGLGCGVAGGEEQQANGYNRFHRAV